MRPTGCGPVVAGQSVSGTTGSASSGSTGLTSLPVVISNCSLFRDFARPFERITGACYLHLPIEQIRPWARERGTHCEPSHRSSRYPRVVKQPPRSQRVTPAVPTDDFT